MYIMTWFLEFYVRVVLFDISTSVFFNGALFSLVESHFTTCEHKFLGTKLGT